MSWEHVLDRSAIQLLYQEKTVLAEGCISTLEEGAAELVFVEVSIVPRCTTYLFHGLHCGFNFAIALGYHGVNLMFVKPHGLAKSRNIFDVHCGPLSDQNMVGTPVQQNDCLTTLVRWGLWCHGLSGSYQANQSSNPSGLGNPEQRKSRSRQLLPRLVGLASIWI